VLAESVEVVWLSNHVIQTEVNGRSMLNLITHASAAAIYAQNPLIE
jgi:hypothetical protein